jgi:hypothetical protein
MVGDAGRASDYVARFPARMNRLTKASTGLFPSCARSRNPSMLCGPSSMLNSVSELLDIGFPPYCLVSDLAACEGLRLLVVTRPGTARLREKQFVKLDALPKD